MFSVCRFILQTKDKKKIFERNFQNIVQLFQKTKLKKGSYKRLDPPMIRYLIYFLSISLLLWTNSYVLSQSDNNNTNNDNNNICHDKTKKDDNDKNDMVNNNI